MTSSPPLQPTTNEKNSHKNNELLLSVIANSIESIIHHVQNDDSAPSLSELAQKAQLSPAHFQKEFTRLTGLSPHDFGRYLRYSKASEFLLNGYPTLESAYGAGLSGNGRLHDLYVTVDAVTPGQYAGRGQGLEIKYGQIPTPIGMLCIGISPRGLCWAAFSQYDKTNTSEQAMRKFWKNAAFTKASADELKPVQNQLIALWRATLHKTASNEPTEHNGKLSNTDALAELAPFAAALPDLKKNPLKLYLEGTNFQIKIWQALLKIPVAGSVDYGALGEYLNMPQSGRAVGNAVGANPISWIIPCHRVIKRSGVIHNYAWGPARKKSLLSFESTNTYT